MNIEQYAKRIRQILGPRNDDSKAVFDLIDELCEENDRLKMRVTELEKSCVNLSSKRIEDTFKEPPMKSWLLEEKADAVEELLSREYLGSCGQSAAKICVINYAKHIRQKAREVRKMRSIVND